MNVVLFGAPGAGKGTLAVEIKKRMDVIHISTGDLFRDNVSRNTPIGQKAKEYMEKGQLVPDEVVIDMVKDRISRDDAKEEGFMLDGFPRTLAQAKALDEVAKIDRVIVIDIDKEVLRKRILGRRSCPKCGKIYNVYNEPFIPKKEGFCDVCNVELTSRKDDNEETFEKRWNTYLEQSVDVIKYYDEREGLVKHLDGQKTKDLSDEDADHLLAI